MRRLRQLSVLLLLGAVLAGGGASAAFARTSDDQRSKIDCKKAENKNKPDCQTSTSSGGGGGSTSTPPPPPPRRPEGGCDGVEDGYGAHYDVSGDCSGSYRDHRMSDPEGGRHTCGYQTGRNGQPDRAYCYGWRK